MYPGVALTVTKKMKRMLGFIYLFIPAIVSGPWSDWLPGNYLLKYFTNLDALVRF